MPTGLAAVSSFDLDLYQKKLYVIVDGIKLVRYDLTGGGGEELMTFDTSDPVDNVIVDSQIE